MRDGKQRRALTQQRAPGVIQTHGDPGVARGLARALDVGDADARRYTHGFHTYPARMHPLTAKRALGVIGVGQGADVVDPFCGSGTVLVEAVLAGCRGIGVDASPLAVRIARAKLWPAPAQRRRALVERASAIAGEAIAEGKAARRSGYVPPPAAGVGGPIPRRSDKRPPPDVDKRPPPDFAPHVYRELTFLLSLIRREPDPELRELLTTVLSSILIKVSLRASDTRGEPVERRVARGAAARLFADRAAELVAGLDALHHDAPRGTPPPRIELGDARDLSFIPPRSVAAVVTSPPYAGTYDYLEQHALRLRTLGLPVESLATREIGARRDFARDVDASLAQWDRDLARALAEIARVMAPGAAAAVLSGDSLAGRPPAARAVHADDTIARLAPSAGLDVVARASAPRAPLGGAERTAFAARPKREHLILLAATSAAGRERR